jgi:methionyl-tRNA formyltransferase
MKKKIVIFANERVGFETTKQILEQGYNVQGVFTSDQKRRSKIADYQDFLPLEQRFRTIPFHRIISPKAENVVSQVKEYDPDLILVISWSQIIPQELLDIPPLGTIGIHYSLLPERRGGAPFTWALIDGINKTGLTLFYYDAGIDTGDIIDQVKIEIFFEDTIKTLLDKTLIWLPRLLLKNLDLILTNQNKRIKQDDFKATSYPPRSPKDGEIDWTNENLNIYNFVRAQTTPYPCAFTSVVDKNGVKKKLIIKKYSIKKKKAIIEGTIEDYE